MKKVLHTVFCIVNTILSIFTFGATIVFSPKIYEFILYFFVEENWIIPNKATFSHFEIIDGPVIFFSLNQNLQKVLVVLLIVALLSTFLYFSFISIYDLVCIYKEPNIKFNRNKVSLILSTTSTIFVGIISYLIFNNCFTGLTLQMAPTRLIPEFITSHLPEIFGVAMIIGTIISVIYITAKKMNRYDENKQEVFIVYLLELLLVVFSGMIADLIIAFLAFLIILGILLSIIASFFGGIFFRRKDEYY